MDFLCVLDSSFTNMFDGAIIDPHTHKRSSDPIWLGIYLLPHTIERFMLEFV